ncbi:hypothetical protein Q0M97_15480 [Staphylococcus aureus]|nr:hypothetical protein [Staphylococcus aureus]
MGVVVAIINLNNKK